MDEFINYAITIVYGVSELMLLSLGLAVIFGMRGVINLAHGELVMVGAYLTLVASREGIPLPLGILGSAVLVGLWGLVLERLIIRRLYGRIADTMLATWGLSLIMVQVVVKIFGTTTEGMQIPLGSVSRGKFQYPVYQFVIIGVAILLMVAVGLIMAKTRFGILARASVQLPDMAATLGVNAAGLSARIFGLGCFTAGLAGAVIAPYVAINPNMGQAFIGQSFLAVIVAGPGFLLGLVGSAGLLGGVENVLTILFEPIHGAVGFLLLAILLVRFLPDGLTGRSHRVRSGT